MYLFISCAVRHTGFLVPQPGNEPVTPAVEAWSPNHWTAREFPLSHSILITEFKAAPFSGIKMTPLL